MKARLSSFTAVYCISACSFGQFTIAGSPSLAAPTDGVTIGTTVGAPPSALTVRGDEMDTPTGEVFRTDAPDGDTWWRLFRGGLEYGTFFSEVANNHLSMNAPRGHMRWYTNSGLRMELSGKRTNGTAS